MLSMLALLATAACARGPQPVDTATLAANLAPVADLAGGDADILARGEYLARIAGCNDCHTPGYAETGGEVPKQQWLVGSPLGWSGPWGTTYPANLRLKLQDMDEAAWLKYSAELHTRPPMPDFAVRTMNTADRTALYRFIRSLGPAGEPAPAYLPPGQAPQAPYVQWVLPPAPAQAPAAG
jgi:mono/diheme cytochrome c family protein